MTVPVAPSTPPLAPGGQVVIPTLNAQCPRFGESGGGIDLNPLDAAHAVLDHLPVIGSADQLVQAVGKIVGTFLGWVSDPVQMAHDLVGWFTQNTIGWNPDAPSCYSPTSSYGFARSVATGDVQLGASSLYSSAYSKLALFAIVVVFAAGIGRVVRAVYDPRLHHWGAVVLETAVRMVAGISAIQLGFAVLDWSLPIFTDVAREVFTTFVSLATSGVDGSDPLGILLFTALGHVTGLGLVALLLVPFLLFQLLKLVLLLVLRFIVISFGIAAAPLFIAIAVYDHRSRVVQWWVSMMLGAAVIPLVFAVTVGVTIGMALALAPGDRSVGSAVTGPLAAAIVIIGGLWVTNRALRACLFGLAGQHSAMTWLRHAAETALFLPAALGGLLAGSALLASGAGASALVGGLGGGRYGSGLVGQAMRGDNWLSRMAGLRFFDTPGEAFSAFKASPAGARFITDVTKGRVPEHTPPARRWAMVESLPGIDSAMRLLKQTVHAESSGRGKLDVTPQTWSRFQDALDTSWARHRAADEDTAPPASGPAGEGGPQ